MGKNVLVIGAGGREHALVWKLAQSPNIGRLYVAPGNGGTIGIAEHVPIKPMNTDDLAEWAENHQIDLTVVGPEQPLEAGIGDTFRARSLPIFGPSKAAAEIETSKAYAKELMQRTGIKTATFNVFKDVERALNFVENAKYPLMVKASGLAGGKGVTECSFIQEARVALQEIMVDRIHGNVSTEVVIEEYLPGPEISLHALSDGKKFLAFPASRDYKTVFDNGEGKNTGGMGTITPVPSFPGRKLWNAEEEIIRPALRALRENRRPFEGLLYPGLKVTPHGVYVLEFNARFGDPETQVYMRLLKSDLLPYLEASAHGTLAELPHLSWRPGFAICVVLASGGYPGTYKVGLPILGIDHANEIDTVQVFHAGTLIHDGDFQTAGGRVLGVTALGDTIDEARERAYEAVSRISFPRMHYRKDIGLMAT